MRNGKKGIKLFLLVSMKMLKIMIAMTVIIPEIVTAAASQVKLFVKKYEMREHFFFCQNLPQEFIIAIVYLLTRRILASELIRNSVK